MKKSKKQILAVSLIILISAAGLSLFFVQKNIQMKKKEQLEISEEERRYPVRTAAGTLADISDFIKINGSVTAEKSVDVTPDTGGRLKSVLADIGDYVKKGTVLAEVDPSKPGLSYTSSPVRSTIEGTVTALPAEVGSTVTEATPVATIGDLSLLQLETEIPEPLISKIRMGSECVVSFIAYPDREFPARVVEISPVVDPLTRTMKIKLEFTGDHSEVKAGMFGSIKLYTETRKNVVTIPFSSVIVRDGEDSVFVLEDDDTVRKVVVETGIISEGAAEIRKGLSAGDIVVTDGMSLLEDGVRVKDVEKMSESSLLKTAPEGEE